MNPMREIRKMVGEGVTQILVMGPPRSGTTIASYIISRELGWKYYPESEIVEQEGKIIHSLFDRVRLPFVAHSNAGISFFRKLGNRPEVLIAFILRDRGEAIASARRIKALNTLNKGYQDRFPDLPLSDYFSKYMYTWSRKRKGYPGKILEIHYLSFQDHPLWVSREKRKRFTYKQIKIGEPV